MNRTFAPPLTSAPKPAYGWQPVRLRMSSFLVAAVVCGAVTLLLVAIYDDLSHWFVLPALACGILCAADGVEWFRGRMDAYDPVGLIGLFGVHFFFLAPLLYVAWDAEMPYVVPPSDWRPWLGGMALLNLLGLCVYRLTRHRFSGRAPAGHRSGRSVWQLDNRRFANMLVVGLLVTLAAQGFVYLRFGGISGYVESYEARAATPLSTSGGGFAGMSYVFAVSESFPILVVMGYAAYTLRRRKTPGWFSVLLVLTLFFVLQLLFGGLRGSRSTVIFALVWAVGIIHFLIRPMPKKLLVGGVVAMLAFMYLYGFYKSLGRSAVSALQEGVALEALEQKSGRSLETILLGDLSRADVQAFFLYRLTEGQADYEYAWGRTYVGAIGLLVPRAVWPERPPTKKKEGTELIHGRERWTSGHADTRVYGLAGEAMLNFGPWGVPLLFLVPAALAGRVRRWLYDWTSLPIVDMRLLMLPFFIRLSFLVLSSDSSNLVFGLFKTGLVPAMVVLMGSRRRPLPAAEASPIEEAPQAWPLETSVAHG